MEWTWTLEQATGLRPFQPCPAHCAEANADESWPVRIWQGHCMCNVGPTVGEPNEPDSQGKKIESTEPCDTASGQTAPTRLKRDAFPGIKLFWTREKR